MFMTETTEKIEKNSKIGKDKEKTKKRKCK